ncbi:MAG TPA: type II secretion system F family protein [Tepidisphaeraceae bacterium]|jgi:type II secretory pathway component PulF
MSSIPLSFAYRAQSVDGQPLSGTIDAADPDQARQQLESLRLRVLEIEPAKARETTGAKRLGGEDFLTFNQQLAHLTSAGLPLEHGLRLIAQDMRRGRVASTIRQIAGELERGEPLGSAFERHASRFPPAYGRLIDAGVRTNNLSGMLLNLGEHLRTLGRVRAALWRAMAYPLAVFVALCLVVAFLGGWVFPQFADIYRMWHTQLPWATQFLIDNGRLIGVIAASLAVAVVALLLLYRILATMGLHRGLQDGLVLRLPLVGPVVQRSLIARWCDAVRIAVTGGMDLPVAMRTAADAVGSNRLERDTRHLIGRLESGQGVDSNERFSVMPATVPAAIELSSRHGGLPQTLATLAQMYQQQAQAKVGMIPAVLTPLMLALLTGIIGFIILAMFLPFVRLISAISGGKW